MRTLSYIREKALEYERAYGAFGRYTKEDRENTQQWLEALSKNMILFKGGLTGIRYDDFSDVDFTGKEINNQEWRAQLNRFFWLEPIAWTYPKTKDQNLAKIAYKTVKAWLDFRSFDGTETNASVWKTTGDNTLSTSIRLGQFNKKGWWGAIPHLEESGFFGETFVDRMLKSTSDQLAFMVKNLTTIGNWRISQLDTLFYVGFCLPDMTDYLEFAVTNLNEAFHTQVHSDGSHEEHTPGYHDWMRDVFTRYTYVQKSMPNLGLCMDPKFVLKMWDYSLAMYTPDGQRWGINDSNCWVGKSNAEKMQAAKTHCQTMRTQFIEDFGLQDDQRNLDASNAFLFFDQAGQIFAKDQKDLVDTLFMYDATIWGGGHCHRARNAISLYHDQKMLLIDPGSLNYERSDPFNAYGKGTSAHNTVTVPGMDQTIVNPKVEQWYDDARMTLIHSHFPGGYQGEKDSLSASHRRTFLWIKGVAALVFDQITSYGGASMFVSRWQSIPGHMQSDDRTKQAWTCFDDANVAVRAFDTNTAIRMNIYEGCKEPYAGWVAKKGQMLLGGEPAPMVEFSTEIPVEHWMLGQLIIPYTGREKPNMSVHVKRHNSAMRMELCRDHMRYVFVSNLLKRREGEMPCQISTADEIACNGKSAFIAFFNEEIVYAWIGDGTVLKVGKEPVIESSEWGDHAIARDV